MIHAAIMFGNKIPNEIAIEDAACLSSRTHNVFIDDVSKLTSKPASDGNRKTHFWSIEDLIGQDVLHCLSKYPLSIAAAKLHLSRHASGKFCQLMIQEWHAALDRCGHRHLVLFHEQFMQISLRVRVKELVQEVV